MKNPTEPGYYWFKGIRTNSVSGVKVQVSEPAHLRSNGFVDGLKDLAASHVNQLAGEWTKLEEPEPEVKIFGNVKPGQEFWIPSRNSHFVKLAGYNGNGNNCVKVGYYHHLSDDTPVDY